MYEALLRERMDAEQAEQLDQLLDRASADEDAPSMAEKVELLREWGGEIVNC